MSFVPKTTAYPPMPRIQKEPVTAMHYCFGDIVVVEGNLIGVVVKSWCGTISSASHEQGEPHHDVYVRELDLIRTYPESEMQRYMVRHKYLSAEEMEYQKNAVNGL